MMRIAFFIVCMLATFILLIGALERNQFTGEPDLNFNCQPGTTYTIEECQ